MGPGGKGLLFSCNFKTYDEFRDAFLLALERQSSETMQEWTYRLPEKILKLRSDTGWTAAHELLKEGFLPPQCAKEDILLLADDNGWTVMHTLVHNMGFFILYGDMLKEHVLGCRDNRGNSVLHHAISRGMVPVSALTEDLLTVRDKHETTAAHVLAKRGDFPAYLMTDRVLDLKDGSGTPVFGILAQKDKLPSRFITPDRAVFVFSKKVIDNKFGGNLLCDIIYRMMFSIGVREREQARFLSEFRTDTLLMIRDGLARFRMRGTGETDLSPDGQKTRDDLLAILDRIMETRAKEEVGQEPLIPSEIPDSGTDDLYCCGREQDGGRTYG